MFVVLSHRYQKERKKEKKVFKALPPSARPVAFNTPIRFDRITMSVVPSPNACLLRQNRFPGARRPRWRVVVVVGYMGQTLLNACNSIITRRPPTGRVGSCVVSSSDRARTLITNARCWLGGRGNPPRRRRVCVTRPRELHTGDA